MYLAIGRPIQPQRWRLILGTPPKTSYQAHVLSMFNLAVVPDRPDLVVLKLMVSNLGMRLIEAEVL